MNIKDLKSRFIFIPIICVAMIYLMLFCRIISLTEFSDIDFKAIDKHLFGQKVLYMTKNNAKNPFMPKTANSGEGDIDINYATAEELQTLPEIGAKRARAIVRQRTKMGGFSVLRDIICADGVGAETFDKIEPYIKISE